MRVEALEGRDCPAASANLFNGVLTVTGSEGNDTITVTQSGGTITAGGRSFGAGAVSRVVITGQAGDDVIRNNTQKPAVIYGGTGNDTIFAGPRGDKVYGGQGNDVITGGAGNDMIWGGGGTNTINATAGRDAVHYGSARRTVGNNAIESQIIQLINAQRVAYGLPPLAVSGQLNAAAQLHSIDMATISNGYGPWAGMQHVLNGTLRPDPTNRLDAVGYDNWSTTFAWGENIAFGYTSAAAVVSAWMNSPEHRANILSSSFTETGVSVVADAAGRLFFTQDFGRRG